MTFPGSIQKDRGQPSLVRIGVIGTDGLVYLQNTALESATVGILGAYTPVAGDTVAVLGQSAIGTAGSSWLILGRLESFAGTPLLGMSMVHAEESRASAAFSFNAAPQVPAGMSLTFDLPAGHYIFRVDCVIDAELSVASTVTGIGRLVINGATYNGEWIFSPRTANVRATIGQFWTTTIDLAEAQTCTVDIDVIRVSGADGQLAGSATHSKVGVLVFR